MLFNGRGSICGKTSNVLMQHFVHSFRLVTRSCRSKNKALVFQFLDYGSKGLSTTTCAPPNKADRSSNLTRQLQAKIKAMGPITVADYMKEVLINPLSGYYMHRDVLDESGDFITSPELGQLFGEMVAVWCISEWQKIGMPIPFQIVEMGPGRGSLAEDLLRVFATFGTVNDVSLHFVEVSPCLSRVQAERLCDKVAKHLPSSENPWYQAGTTASGVPIFWYNHVQDVPRQFSCFLAHEFFDALPIHKFQKTKSGWREILVDIDPETDGEKFRFILSRSPTPASQYFIEENEQRNHVEVSPETGVILEHLATRLEEDGGFALFADYGHDGTKTDTFRAFKSHQLHDPLSEPGTADLTADVDFSYFKRITKGKLLTFGPVAQAVFLRRMGIDVRLDVLLQNCTSKQKESLLRGYHMMMDKDKMGERFKFFSMFPSVLQEHLARFPVSGFSDA